MGQQTKILDQQKAVVGEAAPSRPAHAGHHPAAALVAPSGCMGWGPLQGHVQTDADPHTQGWEEPSQVTSLATQCGPMPGTVGAQWEMRAPDPRPAELTEG